MNIKLDENLPLQLATMLKDLGYDADTALDEGLTGHSDREIWEAAQKESRFLITQDLDFSDSRRFIPGSHHGIPCCYVFTFRTAKAWSVEFSRFFKKRALASGVAISLLRQNARFAC